MASDGSRLVYDGFYYWKARVVRDTSWRGQQGWRAMLDRFFGSRGAWTGYWLDEVVDAKRGKFCKTEADAEVEANRLLDQLDAKNKPREGRYV